MVNAGHSLRLMKQANSRLLPNVVGQWASMPYQDVMHEADDAKDNQREWLGLREGSAWNSSAQVSRSLCQGTIIAGAVRKSDHAKHA
jgi:hypothetical protein